MRVHDLPKTGGILSERQRQWVASAPYDSSTENPVLYKSVVAHIRSCGAKLVNIYTGCEEAI